MRTELLRLSLVLLLSLTAVPAAAEEKARVTDVGLGVNRASPSAALDIEANANQGIAAYIREGSLVVERNGTNPNIRFIADGGSFGRQRWLFMNSVSNGSFSIYNEEAPWAAFVVYPDVPRSGLVLRGSNVGIGVADPQQAVDTATGAYLSTGGTWTDASSRHFKSNVRPLDSTAAVAALRELEPVSFRYLVEPDEPRLGFIAEDVPELVAMQDRKGLAPMELVAVLARVVQEQQTQIDELRIQVKKLGEPSEGGQ